LRIAGLVEATSSGVGRHVVDLTSGLLERGHEVHLVYSEARSDEVFCRDLGSLAQYPSFRARRIMMRHGLHARDLLAARSLRHYVRSHGPFDLVHCHSTKAGLVGRVGLAGVQVHRLYTPNLLMSMGTARGKTVRAFGGLLELGLSKLCDGIIAVSREEYQHAIGLGIDPAKLCLIPNGVAHEAAPARPRAELRRQWGLRDGEVCIGFVGRLVPQKSPETMLRAFAELCATSATSRLVMIGDGPLAGACRRLAAKLGIEAKVVWLGERDAKTLMHAFDMLALTSDSEGHPLVILEAMARGLPVVATRVGGIADTVRSGVNGFVVPVGDTTAVAGSLRALVNDPALRENMGRASRALSREFSVDRMVDRTLELYSRVVAGAWDGRTASELTAAASR
jgi:glycosyltransferase involved in cell wall biosynthesis